MTKGCQMSDKDQKTNHIQIRCTNQQKLDITKGAAASNQSVSKFMLEASVEKAKKVQDD